MPDKDPQGREQGGAEASSPQPGELLAGARRKHGWTPERVAQELNLDAATVIALEESRFESLGAPVFARGHLRKYADLLGIGGDDVMAAYDATMADADTEELERPPSLGGEAARVSRRFGPVVGLVVVAAVAVLLWRIVGNGQPDGPAIPAADTSSPGVETPEVAAGPEPAPVPFSPGEEEAPQPVTAGAPDAGVDETTSEPPVEPATPPVEPATSPVVEELPATVAEGAEETSAAPTLDATASAGEMRLAMRFTADSWVEVRDANGDRLVYQLQREGSARTVSGTPPFRLFLGFADGVEIQVEGQPLVIPAERRLGNTARFQIPLQQTGGTSR